MTGDQPDMFDGYPGGPGWKEGETSRQAAEEMALHVGTLRWAAYHFILKHPYHTADEIASALHQSPLTIRPRISELRLKGLVVSDGRGKNRSGKAAHRWKAVAPPARGPQA